MSPQPTYEELKQRVKSLERELADCTDQNGPARLIRQYLEALLDNTNQPVFLKDAHFRYILVNPQFERLARLSSGQILGRDDFAVFPGRIAELFRSQDLEVRRCKQLIEFQETIRFADGEQTFLITKFPLIDDQGEVYAIGGVCTDVTSLQKAEKALRESEKKYRTLVDTASLGIQISDPEGRIVLSNPAHQAIHGLSEQNILGRFVWDFIEDEAGRLELQHYYRFIIDRQPDPVPYFTTNKTADGREIQVEIDWNYMRDENDEVYALCSIIHDVTDRVRAERALKASEHRCRSVMESCPEGILLYRLEPGGRLVFSSANPAAERILSLDCSRLIGRTIEEAFPALAGTELPGRYRDICLTGRPWKAEQVHYEDDRISGVFEVHAFQTEPGKMAVFFKNVTAKLRMLEELQKNQKLESVGVLAGGIAHDFNNLLTAIIGNISMAKVFARTEPARTLARLNDAENASIRARELTQRLLTFSRGGAPVRGAASIAEVIRESTSFMLSGSDVKLQIQIPEDIWPVDIDVGQIRQVIQNVVKNSDQAMPAGGTITIRAENVLIDAAQGLPLPQGGYVHISLADEGVGIPQKYLARIFDPYFSTRQEGSGLGLAACYSIISHHDGLITVESEYGSGATFHIFLPASAKTPREKIMAREKIRPTGKKILIMDDNESILAVAVNMLNFMGYTTATARDGTEAVRLYKEALLEQEPFDGVLLDLTIPGGMGGLEAIRQLTALDPGIRAIVSSGYTGDPVMNDYRDYGFSGIVTKPYDLDRLSQALRDLFDQGASPTGPAP
ncbi:MAG: PAS domain S-box protein [Desulfobulbaceae bacterium]|jgi:PAS domain S-box-containing protein|nr:PAS domain S-box protein [Desulfobulbaceae bacterium]